jgi:hypothetical protein
MRRQDQEREEAKKKYLVHSKVDRHKKIVR